MNILFAIILTFITYKAFTSSKKWHKRLFRSATICSSLAAAWLYFAVPQLPASVQFINLHSAHNWVAMHVQTSLSKQDELKEQIVQDFTKSVDLENRPTHGSAEEVPNDAKTKFIRTFTGGMEEQINANNSQRYAYMEGFE